MILKTDNNEPIHNIDYEFLKKKVLNFLEILKVGETNFRMSSKSKNTIYSDIFALYTFYLLGEIKKWDKEYLQGWIEHINSFQDEKSGIYIPNESAIIHSKPTYQLTAFALNALSILGGKPRYKLKFIERWSKKEAIGKYFVDFGCWKGLPSSGNMAMFLGIFLSSTYSQDCFKVCAKNDLIDYWFSSHNQNQNPLTGFWDNCGRYNPYYNLQNGFHQFQVYNYWNREVINYSKIIDSVLLMQAIDGCFSPTLGGGACFDYDAVNTLIQLGYKNNYRVNDIENALRKNLSKLITLQNPDGGFCENNNYPNTISKLLSKDNFVNIFSSRSWLIFFVRLKFSIKTFVKKEYSQKTHFANQPIPMIDSDMWSTWFRLQTIAEIEAVLEPDKGKWLFQKHIGLGYNKQS